MLNWVLLFGGGHYCRPFGFTGIAVQAAGIAKILFFIFLILFVFSLVMHLVNKNRK